MTPHSLLNSRWWQYSWTRTASPRVHTKGSQLSFPPRLASTRWTNYRWVTAEYSELFEYVAQKTVETESIKIIKLLTHSLTHLNQTFCVHDECTVYIQFCIFFVACWYFAHGSKQHFPMRLFFCLLRPQRHRQLRGPWRSLTPDSSWLHRTTKGFTSNSGRRNPVNHLRCIKNKGFFPSNQWDTMGQWDEGMPLIGIGLNGHQQQWVFLWIEPLRHKRVHGETAMCLFHSALSLTVDEPVAGRFPYKSKIGGRIGTPLSHHKPGVFGLPEHYLKSFDIQS